MRSVVNAPDSWQDITDDQIREAVLLMSRQEGAVHRRALALNLLIFWIPRAAPHADVDAMTEQQLRENQAWVSRFGARVEPVVARLLEEGVLISEAESSFLLLAKGPAR